MPQAKWNARLSACRRSGRMRSDIVAGGLFPDYELSDHRGMRRTISALQTYANALEVELWMMQEARTATLLTRRDHERLTRAHGAIAQQALQVADEPLGIGVDPAVHAVLHGRRHLRRGEADDRQAERHGLAHREPDPHPES